MLAQFGFSTTTNSCHNLLMWSSVSFEVNFLRTLTKGNPLCGKHICRSMSIERVGCWYLLQRVCSHKRSWWTLDARLEFPSLLPIYVRVEVIQIWLLNKWGSAFKSNYLENTFQSSPTRVDSMTFQNTDCTLLSLSVSLYPSRHLTILN